MEPRTTFVKKIIGSSIATLGLITIIAVSIVNLRKPLDMNTQDTSTTTDPVNTITIPPDAPTIPTIIVSNTNTSVTPPSSPTPVTTTTTTPTTATQPTPVDIPKQTTPAPVTYAYTDGAYTATGSYRSPGGYDELGVNLTLHNDIITDVNVTLGANDNTSLRYQEMFVANYKQYVVGKDISTVHLTKVSGSSLTPQGFNDALAQIESQAKA
jgi:hypothetical protein